MKNSKTLRPIKGLSLLMFLFLTFFIGPICIFSVWFENLYCLLLLLPLVLWSNKIVVENIKSPKGAKVNSVFLFNLIFGFATGIFWVYLWILIAPFLLLICIAEIKMYIGDEL